jgi:F-type H+-transporting ATPase subunit delta
MDSPEAPKTRVPSVLEDPSAKAVARVYANAFLDAAAESGASGALEEFASFMDDIVARFPDFAAILLSGGISRDDKLRLIDKVVRPYGSPLFTNFLAVLARHERLDLLPTILGESQEQHELRSGRRRVQVSSARALATQEIGDIGRRIREALDFEPLLQTRVDPALLGGVIIRIGDTVYDSSLRSRMKQLRERLRKRSIHEIQIGRDRFSHSERD